MKINNTLEIAMTRVTAKNRVNRILSDNSKGIYSDDYWCPIHKIFNTLLDSGFPVQIMSTKYRQNEDGLNISKEWRIQIPLEIGKPLDGIITAHGAGSIHDPLDRYDISAYVM
jgi:hypothetical protein